MAQRRMFSINELQSDSFLELSFPAQMLYVQLSLNADDDGMVSRVKGLLRLCNVSDKELQELVSSGYLIDFGTEVYTIADWLVNNKIRKDRYTKTIFRAEFNQLIINDNLWYTKRQPDDNQSDTNGVHREVKVKSVESKEVEPREVELRGGEVNTAIGKDSLKGKPAKGKKSASTSEFITDDLITKVLKHNQNDINRATLEFIDSGVPIDSFGDRIHELSKKLSEQDSNSSGKRAEIQEIDKVTSNDD